MSQMHRVFVYGTLKMGEPNHHWFNKTKEGIWKFLGQAQTVQKYPLVIATKYNIPFLLHRPGEGHHVKGEIYEINDETLENLDILEDHPNFYVREIEPFLMLENSKEPTEAWVYFLKTFKPHLLEKQMFETYSSSGDHGLKYMERYQRNIAYDYKSEVFFKNQQQ